MWTQLPGIPQGGSSTGGGHSHPPVSLRLATEVWVKNGTQCSGGAASGRALQLSFCRGTQLPLALNPWSLMTPMTSRPATQSACFSDNRGSSLQPWNFPGPTQNWVLLKADVTKAHRRIKILLQEWRYQVAQLGDEWWVSTVGTYGVASAQLYWGRLAAILLRIVYAVFPEVDWGFVFVDDFAWLLRKSSSPLLATAICLLLLALRTPLSWKKTVLAAS